MSQFHPVGIDVGATHTVMARVNPAGHSEILHDREGNRLIPSLVLYDDQRYAAGEEARLRGVRKSESMGRLAKLSLGRPLHDLPIRGERFPPEVIQGCLLHHLRRELDAQLKGEYGVVLAVPAFFGELRRKAAADAGEMAGLRVLDLINEPTAAALAFGEHTGFLTASGAPLRWLRALVYNLNGFTFETTLLEISPGGIKTAAVDGDLTLGGYAWDERLADCAAEQFIRQHGVDPREHLPTREQLLARARRAKHSLGLRQQVHFPLEFEGRTLEVRLARREFVHATVDLVERSLEITERMLATAGVGWPLVDRVLLTGGATQMPMIRQRLQEKTGREPDFSVHPEEAVARGAALYARNLLQKPQGVSIAPKFQLANLATRSLGIQGVDPQTGEKINKVLIERGSPLPAKATEKFLIHPNQTREVVITVLEGESRQARECEVVAKAIINDLPPDLSRTADEWPVAVTCEYSASGRLRIEARVCYTEHAVRLELSHTAGMSRIQRGRWKALVESEAPFASFQAELRRRRNVPVALATTSAEEAGATPPGDAAPAGESLLERARRWLYRRAPEEEHAGQPASAPASNPTDSQQVPL